MPAAGQSVGVLRRQIAAPTREEDFRCRRAAEGVGPYDKIFAEKTAIQSDSCFCYMDFNYASMVEMVRVVSSRTSSRALTVSREVNMVTLYSVAI